MSHTKYVQECQIYYMLIYFIFHLNALIRIYGTRSQTLFEINGPLIVTFYDLEWILLYEKKFFYEKSNDLKNDEWCKFKFIFYRKT